MSKVNKSNNNTNLQNKGIQPIITTGSGSSITKRKLTPKILVTDVRSNNSSNKNKFSHATASPSPLAKTSSLIKEMISEKNYKKRNSFSRDNNLRNNTNNSLSHLQQSSLNGRRGSTSSKNKYDMITMDRLAPQSEIVTASNRHMHNSYSFRNKSKLRSSKTTEKLVLIPTMEEYVELSGGRTRRRPVLTKNGINEEQQFSQDSAYFTNLGYESANEDILAKMKTNSKRVTAYNTCEAINLLKISKILRKQHNITTRLYDECLYCTFTLPLSSKIQSNLKQRELLMNRNEMKDHHYEYYSIKSDNPEEFRQDNDSQGSGSASDGESVHEIGELFIFNYGSLVLWNFSLKEENEILKFLNIIQQSSMVEIENYKVFYNPNLHKPIIINDLIQLPNERDHMVKLAISHPLAQSCKVSKFESRIIPILLSVSKLPKRLALYGKLGMSREKLLKKFGKLFKLRVDVNLSSNVLDKPDFFWNDEPSLDPLYEMARNYLELDERVEILNEKGRVFLEFVDICVDSIAEKTMSRINMLLIIVFCLSVIVSVVEILVRYFIIKRQKE